MTRSKRLSNKITFADWRRKPPCFLQGGFLIPIFKGKG
nr:MAG TPA: hypothetical protein [Caudoviricetes sp.]